MNNEHWEHWEHLAKSGQIELIADDLVIEIKSRLSKSADHNIDIRDLIISAYDLTKDYTIKGFVAVLVDLLSYPGVKAKPSE